MLIDYDEAIEAILKDFGVDTMEDLDRKAVSGDDAAIGIQRAIAVLENMSKREERGVDDDN